MLKRFLQAFKRGWMKFAHVMAIVNTNILMFIVYFILVPFFSLIRFKDPLKKKLDSKTDSYWVDKDPVNTTMEGMQRLF